jgi:uncharacterized protein (DUF169 family)
MTSEAQKKAVKKYKQKLKRITVDFYPTEDELWEHINKQDKKQTYIKDLIRADMEKGPQWVYAQRQKCVEDANYMGGSKPSDTFRKHR